MYTIRPLHVVSIPCVSVAFDGRYLAGKDDSSWTFRISHDVKIPPGFGILQEPQLDILKP